MPKREPTPEEIERSGWLIYLGTIVFVFALVFALGWVVGSSLEYDRCMAAIDKAFADIDYPKP